MIFLQKLLLWPAKGIAALVSYSPVVVRSFLAWCLAILWFDVFRIRRKVAVENVQRAFPNWSPAQVTSVARRSIFHLCVSIVEFAHFPFMTRSRIPDFFVVEGVEHLERALKQEKGVLLLTLHLGSGDFAMSAFSLMGYKMNMISKLIKTKWLNDLWFGLRGMQGTRFISHERSSFEILKALKRNDIVMFVLDQFMGPPVGVKTRFFGQETGTAAGLAIIAERTKAPVLPAYTFRLPDGRHVARFEAPLLPLDHGPDVEKTREENITVMTQAYTDKLESIVREHPDQWMWIHRRWKKFG